MPAKRKYSTEQRVQCFELFKQGRDMDSKNSLGTHTCAEISEITKVDVKMVWAIARGVK